VIPPGSVEEFRFAPPRKFMKFHAYLRSLRETLGFSLRDVEHLTGMPFSHLSQIETGKRGRRISMETVARLSMAYGKRFSEICRIYYRCHFMKTKYYEGYFKDAKSK
jgi:transcriptional regulator with XRE-family HTH domain